MNTTPADSGGKKKRHTTGKKIIKRKRKDFCEGVFSLFF
jgi:hypothetical protein